jgi:hypothetical protein
MPMALVWLSVGHPESLTHIHGALSETCNTEYKANVIALDKAKNWVDPQPVPPWEWRKSTAAAVSGEWEREMMAVRARSSDRAERSLK